MSRKYIKKRIEQNFVYPNNERKLYDTEIVHDINDNCVSGDINLFSATTVSQTGITIQYSFDWDANGAELFQMENGDYSYVSVHMMTPDQSYLKPFRVVFNVQSSTLYTGTTTFTGTTTITPNLVGVNTFVNGDYYYEVRFIGHRCIYPICGSLDITTLPGPTPTPTPTTTPTPTPTVCTCVDYTLTNTGNTAFLVSYQECPFGESVINFVAQTGQSYNFCACQDSVGYEGGSPAQLVNNGPCVTPTPTSTPTSTPTPTPTGELNINAKYINNEAVLQYNINGGGYTTLGNIDSLTCTYFFTITGLSNGDILTFKTTGDNAINGSTTDCPNSTFCLTLSYSFTGNTTIYITVDGSVSC